MTATAQAPNDDFEELLAYLQEARGFDFTGYKRASLMRRFTKRMQAVGLDGDFRAYQELLEAQPDEFAELSDTILINVTGFFRDRPAWDYLATQMIPRILEDASPDAPIRVWSAGCASGEEVYSLAILLCDAAGEARFREGVKIYGTDVDGAALLQARQGRYREGPVREAMSDDQLRRYFEPDAGGVVFRKDLRRSLIFGRHDLVQDPPISRVDLLLCRNTLMYFNAETQRRILANFHFALNDGGFLFLGKSEALVTRTNLFELEDNQHHVFRRRGDRRRDRNPAPRMLADREYPAALIAAAFETSPVAQLVIDGDGVVQLATRHARALFGLGLGDVGRPLRDLEVSYRPVELRSRLEQVLTDRRPVTIGDVEVDLPGGVVDYVDIQLVPLGGEHGAGVTVTFTEVGQHKALREELERARQDLATAHEELQSTVEELETTNEELQSANEELETTNEELHSTNEELETMNEELQSTVEELETTNAEVRQRSYDLDKANHFLTTILAGLGSGIAVLDREMTVRVWNSQAEDLWGLRSDEVEGQHFLNLDIGLPLGDLRKPIRDCLTGKANAERIVLSAINRRGRTINCNILVSALLDGAASPDGVVVRMDPAGGPD